MKRIKKITIMFLVLTMIFVLAACGNTETSQVEDENNIVSENDITSESDLSYVKGNGKLIIGYTDYAPMNYTDENGVFTGFDTELATIVTEKLGLEPEFVEINWDTKEVELNAKSIDCIWNGLTIDDER
ncbi:MAG: transporter substrate-binding domain-containing protein, partial [Clostridiales bacterium]|nr:transporter substrate-binding domain-containing protein [Clostridiales bacterium]